LNKIDKGLSSKLKHLLLKYVSHKFDSEAFHDLFWGGSRSANKTYRFYVPSINNDYSTQLSFINAQKGFYKIGFLSNLKKFFLK